MIYDPSDDSFLLERNIKYYVIGKKVLDMGTGSGILAISAKNEGASSVLAADINKQAVLHLKKLGIKSVHSNLFSKINGKFDVIVFNPPYLPEDKREDKDSSLITAGGKRGDEVIVKFIKQSKSHLEKKGIILLLVSTLTPMEKINKEIKKAGMNYKVIDSRRIFMEELKVLEIRNS